MVKSILVSPASPNPPASVTCSLFFLLTDLNSMGRQTRSKKSDPNVVGKGKVTPVQVAFIVDRYLADNNFSGTRSLFRSEASSLLTRAPVQEAPKSLLSLSAMLEEYISLKEQKVIVDQSMSQLEMEKIRIRNLSQGVQGLLNAYNSPPSSMVISPAGYPAIETPVSACESMPNHSVQRDHVKYSTPVLNSSHSRKRKSSSSVPQIPQPTKKSCGLTSDNPSTSYNHVASPHDIINATSISQQVMIPDRSPVQGSTVAKNLFNSSSDSPNSNSSGLQTPKRSTSSHSDKSIVNNTSLETTPTNCTIISSKRIIVNSPAKQYSIERKQCTFSSPSKTNLVVNTKRDQVKGRLDFDTTDLPIIAENASPDFCTTSESDKDCDLFDIDFDALGPEFSLSELLHDFGIDCEAVGASTDPLTGSPSQPNIEGDYRVSQDLIAQDLTTKGSDSITSMRSITQCIQILSPSKKSKSF